MKNKALLTTILAIVTTLILGTAAFAAPVVDLSKGETTIGYTYLNPSMDITVPGASIDCGKVRTDNYFIQHGLTKDLTIGLERTEGDKTWTGGGNSASLDSKFTDIYLQQKINSAEVHGLSLILGNRHYNTTVSATIGGQSGSVSESTNKLLYGVAYNQKLTDEVNGYISYKKAESLGTDWTIGATVNINKDAYLDVNYRKYKEDYDNGSNLELKGFGVGLNYKF